MQLLFFDDASQLIVYHTGQTEDMKINGNSFVGSYKPSQFIFMTDYDGTAILNGNGDFSGLFVAPKLTVSMKGTFTLDGALVAKSFDSKINGTYNFLYDTELSNLVINIPVSNVIDFSIVEYGSR